MKKLIAILLITVLMFQVINLPAFADGDSFTSEEYECVVLEDGTVEIIAYNGTATDLVIPNMLDNQQVTSIGDCAFCFNMDLQTVEIPDSVTQIKWMAFAGCSSLTNVTLPDSVQSIDSIAFSSCDNLTLIVGENSYAKSYCVENELPHAFSSVQTVTSITPIPATNTPAVTATPTLAPTATPTLVPTATPTPTAADIRCTYNWADYRITLEDWNLVPAILDQPLKRCTGFTFTLHLGNIQSGSPYGEWTLYGQASDNSWVWLESFNASRDTTIVDISLDAPMDIYSLCAVRKRHTECAHTYSYEIRNPRYDKAAPMIDTIDHQAKTTDFSTEFSVSPDNSIFETIDDVVFNKVEKVLVRYSKELYSLSVYTVPSNTRIIGPAAFAQCDNLISITLPDGVERIEERAFSGCALEYINLPSSIQYIAKDAIEANPKLVIEVKSGSYAEQYCKENNLNYRCSDPHSSFESGIINGVYCLVPQCAPNSCLTAEGSNYDANVQIYESNGSSAQKFRFEKLANGCYEIICELSGMALSAADAVAEVGTNVQLLYRNGTDAQQWNLVSVGNGFYYIVSKLDANLVLDVWGGVDQNGTEVQIWGKNETPAQKWSLIQ